MHVADHLPLDELRSRAAAEADKRRFVRIRAVILAIEGSSAPMIDQGLGYSRRAVQAWVARYNAEGSESYGDRPRPGQPTHLPSSLVEAVRRRIDAGPQPEDGVCTVRVKDVREILRAEFGVTYSLPGVYLLLNRLGHSCLDPRPRHRKADPAAQEEFKKVAVLIDEVALAHPEKRVEVWFEDEARFGQKGTLTTV